MTHIKLIVMIFLIYLLTMQFQIEPALAVEMGFQKNTINSPSATIMFDDGEVEDYTIMYPYFKSKGIKGCSALISSQTGKNINYLNMYQINEMNNYGWDFLSHTTDHLDLTSLSVSDVNYQLKSSKDFYESKGIEISGLVYPFNNYNDNVVNEVKKYYSAAFGYYNGKELYNTNLLDNRYNIYRLMLEVPLATNKKIIDEAIRNNGWVVFMGHGHYYRSEIYADNSVWPGKWDNNLQKTKETIEYLLSKGVRIVTVKEALKEKACTKLGWNFYQNNWYYLKNDYSLANGWERIDNKWYYFHPSGQMAANITIEGYALDSSGAWISV